MSCDASGLGAGGGQTDGEQLGVVAIDNGGNDAAVWSGSSAPRAATICDHETVNWP